MSLTERPGIFLGTKHNRSQWYLVDPAAAEGADPSAEAWRRRWADTNRSQGRRLFTGVVFWLVVAVGLFVGAVAGALLVQVFPSAFFGATCLGFGGLLAGGALALKLQARLVPPRGPVGAKVPGVVPLALELANWPEANELPISDLWQLNDAVTKTKQLLTVFNWWGPRFGDDDDEPGRPVWALVNLVEPILLPELARHQSELSRVAARVGYPIPQTLSAEPPSFSEYAED